MTKGATATERDAAKERLAAMMSSGSAPGTKQAEKAVKKKAPPPAVTAAPKAVKPKPTARPDPERKARKAKPQNGAGKGKAEKVSVSLHPVDQERAEGIEDVLRDAGLIGRRAPTSFLLKVALAAFDPKRVENLAAVVDEVKGQDGRGKWMHSLKRQAH